MKIKKGDNVKIIAGKDKGKTGKIAGILLKENRVIVENSNVHIRHRRSRKQGQKGEKVQVAMPIHASNVLVICTVCKKPSRLGFQKKENGAKIRICKKCKSELP